MQSKVWDAFEKSDYAKKVTASKTVEAKDSSAPGCLESVNWQKGNGNVPDVTKTHDIKEVHDAMMKMVNKAPTGRTAATLVKLVRIAEAWEQKNDPTLAPFIAELDDIINTTLAEASTEVVTAEKKTEQK